MNEMNCKECAKLLHAYLDNELDAASAIHVGMHLEACAGCKTGLKDMQALRAGLRQKLPYHEAPGALRQNILSQIRKDVQPARPSTPWRWLMPAFSAAALAMAAVLYVAAPGAQDVLADEIVASHVRSLMEQHLTDVASSDRHTVKPWFAGKLDFSPPVYDFTAQNYPLIGGRLDYIRHQTVAALSYRRNKHVINVFIMPTDETDSGMQTQSMRGYNLVAWRQNHLSFEAVSDLNAKELEELCELIKNQSK